MDGKQLKMNDGKTEFIMFRSKYQLNKCVTHQININGVSVQKSDVIRYLGAWMDKHLSFKHHIKVKCKVAMFNLIRIMRLGISHRIHVQHPGHESGGVAH